MEEFDEIYRLYAGDVYRYILGISRNETLAKDILQSTMLKAFMTADKFRGESSVKTWLCGIAKNEYLNSIKRSENKNLPLDEAINAVDENIEHIFSDKFQAMEIHKILHELDEPYKEIFSLRVFAELKFSDIGEIFGKSENWARVTFYRAKEKIIKILQKQED
ncbi:MAG: sigma-70 family RNA polymerase sigma factor [Ruminococcus sp.]|nr:sigma-70 family RNA polymerase sigma factor [Ruminococcus sp.]